MATYKNISGEEILVTREVGKTPAGEIQYLRKFVKSEGYQTTNKETGEVTTHTGLVTITGNAALNSARNNRKLQMITDDGPDEPETKVVESVPGVENKVIDSPRRVKSPKLL